MKSMKAILRIWITTASVAGFMGGWALLAHAEKPAPIENNKPSASALAPLPTLQPLQPLNSNNSNNSSSLQQFNVQPQQRSFFPRMRTGGS